MPFQSGLGIFIKRTFFKKNHFSAADFHRCDGFVVNLKNPLNPFYPWLKFHESYLTIKSVDLIISVTAWYKTSKSSCELYTLIE